MADNITRFVLLFEGRTGSTFIMNALNSHPSIISEGEILVRKSAQEQNDIMRALYGRSEAGIKAIGFKTKLRDIADTENFLTLLDEFDVKVIFMYRKNLIKLALSRLNAKRLFEHTGRWNQIKGENPLPPFAPSIEEFEQALEFRRQKEEELKEFMERITRPLMVRYYEDLLEERDVLFNNIFSYINVPPADLQSNVVKNTDDDMRNILLNYDQIKEHYKGTEYEEMF